MADSTLVQVQQQLYLEDLASYTQQYYASSRQGQNFSVGAKRQNSRRLSIVILSSSFSLSFSISALVAPKILTLRKMSSLQDRPSQMPDNLHHGVFNIIQGPARENNLWAIVGAAQVFSASCFIVHCSLYVPINLNAIKKKKTRVVLQAFLIFSFGWGQNGTRQYLSIYLHTTRPVTLYMPRALRTGC